jgi:hypothetical protein
MAHIPADRMDRVSPVVAGRASSPKWRVFPQGENASAARFRIRAIRGCFSDCRRRARRKSNKNSAFIASLR